MRSLEWRRWWRLPLFNLFRRRRAGKQKQESLTTEAVPDIRYEGESFRMVEGLDDVKVVLERSLRLQRETLLSGSDLRLHILLAGLSIGLVTRYASSTTSTSGFSVR
jgi:hypothetical protein